MSESTEADKTVVFGPYEDFAEHVAKDDETYERWVAAGCAGDDTLDARPAVTAASFLIYCELRET